jgi:hypothetical protein
VADPEQEERGEMSIVTALLAFFGTAFRKWIAGIVGVLTLIG